jgi:hypothetical protein
LIEGGERREQSGTKLVHQNLGLLKLIVMDRVTFFFVKAFKAAVLLRVWAFA